MSGLVPVDNERDALLEYLARQRVEVGPEVEAWSVRWVLLHLIEETARHVSHADVIRESIDAEPPRSH